MLRGTASTQESHPEGPVENLDYVQKTRDIHYDRGGDTPYENDHNPLALGVGSLRIGSDDSASWETTDVDAPECW